MSGADLATPDAQVQRKRSAHEANGPSTDSRVQFKRTAELPSPTHLACLDAAATESKKLSAIRQRIACMRELDRIYAFDATWLSNNTVLCNGSNLSKTRPWASVARVVAEWMDSMLDVFEIAATDSISNVALYNFLNLMSVLKPKTIAARQVTVYAMATLQMAVKTHAALKTMCIRPLLDVTESNPGDAPYEVAEIVRCEADILLALDWHIHPVTASHFVEQVALLLDAPPAVVGFALDGLHKMAVRCNPKLYSTAPVVVAAAALHVGYGLACSVPNDARLVEIADCTIDHLHAVADILRPSPPSNFFHAIPV